MIFDILTVTLVVFAVLAWGGNDPWSTAIIQASAIAIFFIRFAYNFIRNRSARIKNWSFYALLLVLSAYFVIGALFGMKNAGEKGFLFWGSVEKYSSIYYLLLLMSYFAIIALVDHGFSKRKLVKALLVGVIVLGVFEAVYGLIQYLGDFNYIWAIERKFGGVASGTFRNRNHFALMVNMSICAAAGYLYYRSRSIIGQTQFSWKRVIAAPGAAKLLWIVFWIALMGVGAIFSMSRMGIAAMIFGLSAIIIASNAIESGRKAIAIGLIIIFLILGFAIYIGVDSVLDRFESISKEREFEKDRMALWIDAWKMIKKYPVFGQGLGTFQWTYPAYESVDPDIPAKYAHNDYLQALAEMGAVGLGLLLIVFGAIWRLAIKNLKNSRDMLVRGIGLGTIGVLTVIALQEITDYGLYIPGVAMVASLLIGLNLRARSLPDKA